MDAPHESIDLVLLVEMLAFIFGLLYLFVKSEEILEDAREAGGTGKWIIYIIIYPLVIIINILALVGLITLVTEVRDWWHKGDRNRR